MERFIWNIHNGKPKLDYKLNLKISMRTAKPKPLKLLKRDPVFIQTLCSEKARFDATVRQAILS